jgi:RNA polymerase sigma-70 factor, ECF subfamily
MIDPGPEPGDDALVAGARQGDPAAFDLLVRRHYRAAYAVALAALGRRSDAEDVCQDSWVRALEKLDDCRQPGRFLYWLLTIVRNRAHNLRDARRVRRTEPLEPDGANAREDPIRDLEQTRLREELEAALQTLRPAQREVVLLHDLAGLSHREIGESLGISEGMCRQHLFQARQELRRRLARKEGTDDA